MKDNISKDIGDQIIQKLQELNKKLDKIFGGKDEEESSDSSIS